MHGVPFFFKTFVIRQRIYFQQVSVMNHQPHPKLGGFDRPVQKE